MEGRAGKLRRLVGGNQSPPAGRSRRPPGEQKEISELHFEFDPHNRWFLRLRELYLTAAAHFRGNALLSMVDLGGVLDILSTFRPGELLLYDLIDEPEQVKRVTKEIEEAWRKIYWELYGAQNAAEYGCTDWSTIYSRSPSYVLQCDFCYMIGTDMFEEFVLHTLQRDCLALTNTLYHLDGEGELRHLDRLLSIPALKAVQWVPGAGKPNVIPVYTDDWGARRRHRQLLRAEAFLRPHHGKADGPPQNFLRSGRMRCHGRRNQRFAGARPVRRASGFDICPGTTFAAN